INVFTGGSEEDDEGRVSQPPHSPPPRGGGGGGAAWEGPAFSEGAGAGASMPQVAAQANVKVGGEEIIDDPSLATRLEAEAETDYYARVYKEYVNAKRAAGEDVSSIPAERLVQRLKANEANLTK